MEKPDCICPVCSEVFTGEEGVTAYLPVGVDLLEQSPLGLPALRSAGRGRKSGTFDLGKLTL